MTGTSGAPVLDRLRHVGSRTTLMAPLAVTSRPSVSVVIPCYNYGKFLPTAIASVTDQPGVDVEVILIDDASPDGSAEVGARLAAADPRIRFIAHQQNMGHIATYNEGLAAATGKYSVLMSADDLLAPGSLGRATAIMETFPSIGMVYGSVVPFIDTPPSPRTDATAWGVWSGQDWLTIRCDRGTNNIRSPEVVVRTSTQAEAGGYRADLPHSGDMEMWIRLASLADVGRVVGSHQAYYRIHGQNMHTEVFGSGTGDGILTDLRNRLLVFEAWQEWSVSGPDRTELVERARRALAQEALVLGCRAYRWGLVDEWPVGGLRGFAVDTFPGAPGLPEWRALDRHVQVGAGRARRYPPFMVSDQLDKAQHRWRMTRERWTGV